MTLEITLEVAMTAKKEILEKMKNGDVFIHPTDTVYGIGCDATNPSSVQRIKDIKKSRHPLSVIAPSMQWIRKNLIVNHDEFLNKFPGPYTLIMKKNDPEAMPWISKNDKIGVRMPDHLITDLIKEFGKPFITTSLNISGKPVIKNLKDLTKNMVDCVDVIINAGILKGRPSTVYDLSGPKIVKIR
ncbi:MAG: threonylcarbamoyl-AMP synthase [Nanoarchaeota archaeon]|nr:threonylcarbamoyl-AMP synthase [Nanoarchaeota archaeon]MBU2520005.1 threonylcarbamoyl-AMP synthase [Nanoarchaeota archaeon]